MSQLRIAALSMAATLIPAIALAQGTTAEVRNYSGERFRLSLDRDGIIDVEWGQVAPHLGWDVSLYVGGADDPIVVNRNVNGRNERVGRLLTHRIGGSLMFAIGLFDWVQVGLDLPVILHQARGDDIRQIVPGIDDVQSFRIGDLRFVPKVRLLRSQDHIIDLAIIPAITLPTSGQSDYAGDGFTFAPEIAIGRGWDAFRLAGNIGYRFREGSTFLAQTVENELYLRAGAGYRFAGIGGPPIEIDLTLDTATSGNAPFTDANQNPLELIGGVSYNFTGPLLAFAGAGVGLNRGFSTPDYRAFVGVRLSGRDEDRDNDGIKDDKDLCPDSPEDKDDFADSDGCPDPDNDDDKVLDEDDGAPNDPEDIDGFEDKDGVPDPDNDKDGVLDVNDNCPLVAGTKANKGCPAEDSDLDGIMDDKDRCPQEKEDRDEFEDEDGCPDPDNDGDTVLDPDDDCPLTPGVPENQGCADVDTDGDGVVDRLDNCPTEAGTESNHGCKQKQLVRISAERIEILDKVYFKTNSAKIRRRSYKLLNNVAAVVLAHPEISRIRVEGHTDDRGNDEYNQDLSQRRAESVKRYLVKKGVVSSRLDPVGFGEEQPVASNRTKKGRAKNRRVEFRIVGNKPSTIRE